MQGSAVKQLLQKDPIFYASFLDNEDTMVFITAHRQEVFTDWLNRWTPRMTLITSRRNPSLMASQKDPSRRAKISWGGIIAT